MPAIFIAPAIRFEEDAGFSLNPCGLGDVVEDDSGRTCRVLAKAGPSRTRSRARPEALVRDAGRV